MIVSEYKIYRVLIYCLLLVTFFACADESFVGENNNGEFLSITGIGPLNVTHDGTAEDHIVSTLRIIEFDPATGICLSNVLYTKEQWTNNIIMPENTK